MKISDFIKKLLPFFARSRVQEDLRNTTTELQTMVLPTLKTASAEVKGAFKSQEAKDFMAVYKLTLRPQGANYFTDMFERMGQLTKVLDAITRVVNAEFEDKVVSAGMNVKKANAVRLLGVIGFLNKFAMSLVNATLHFELQAAGATMPYVSDVTPGELARLKKYMPDFVQFLNSVTAIKDPEQAFDEIADVLVGAETFSSVFGETKIDPFKVFIASDFRGNPLYMVGMMVAEYQHNQYKKMEAQKQAIEKRLIAMRRSANGQPSPQVERELEVLTSRIASLSEDMRKHEESLA